MTLDVPELSEDIARHVVFYDASWNFYEAVLREYDGQNTRINYCKNTLEIFTRTFEHEHYETILGLMVGSIALELELEIAHGGSTNLKLQSKNCGIEPDNCYWLLNERSVRGLKHLDLEVHPAPDLVLEIGIMEAVADRESILAVIGVGEMGHYGKASQLTAWELTDGAWTRIERSKSFPMIRIADLNPYLARLMIDGDTQVLLDFRNWLQQLPR